MLTSRIKSRGRAEEQGISRDFLVGLSGYYTTLPLILKNKYKVETLVIDVSAIDIRGGQRTQFLDAVSAFLSA